LPGWNSFVFSSIAIPFFFFFFPVWTRVIFYLKRLQFLGGSTCGASRWRKICCHRLIWVFIVFSFFLDDKCKHTLNGLCWRAFQCFPLDFYLLPELWSLFHRSFRFSHVILVLIFLFVFFFVKFLFFFQFNYSILIFYI
jgi:hypothetical protein